MTEDGEFERDLEDLSATLLAKKYSREWNSWRNLKARVRRSGGTWAPEFSEWRSFLKHVGKAGPSQTLDRIDNSNPSYGPGLCRWATPEEQSANRANTKLVRYNGALTPLTKVARELGIKPGTIRNRIARGWTDEDAIFGRSRKRVTGPLLAEARTEWSELLPSMPDKWAYHEHKFQHQKKRGGYNHRALYITSRLNAALAGLDGSGDRDPYGPPSTDGVTEATRSRELLAVRIRIAEIWMRRFGTPLALSL